MKITKYILGFAIVAMGFAATSCDTDAVGAIYDSPSQSVSMQEATASVATAESNASVTVRIVRAVKSGSYTANYTAVTNGTATVTDNGGGTVTFADGEGSKEIVVTATNMEPGTTTTYTITLSDADVATADTITNSAKSSEVITFTRDFTWQSAGTCTFYDGFWYSLEDGYYATNVEVQHAIDTRLYKIIRPFYYSSNISGDDIRFYLDENNNASHLPLGWGDRVSGYWFYYDAATYPEYCTFTNEGDYFKADFLCSDDKTSMYFAAWQMKWDGWPGNN